jgi:hypothetical protein
MIRVKTYTAGVQVLSADLNAIQDDASPVNNGAWLGSPPDVWCADGAIVNFGNHNGFVISNVSCVNFAATTLASGEEGVTLPQATITVASTSGFVSAGQIFVPTDSGTQTVTYTGLGGGGITFTGCSGGTGTMHKGNPVSQVPTVMTTTGLSSATWYYVYGYNIGSTALPLVAYEYSTTAPDSTHTFKTSDTSRKYLSCFYTWTSATTIVCFRKSAGLYLYSTLDAHTGTPPYAVLSAGSATSFTDVNCANAVPPHVRMAKFGLGAVASTSSGTTAVIQTKGGAGLVLVTALGTVTSNNAANKWYTWADMETDSSQKIQYKLTNPGTLDVTVQGFCESQ